jgi:hypothetical protein
MNFLNTLLLFLIFVSITSYYFVPWAKGTKPPFNILISWWVGVFFVMSMALGLVKYIYH